MGYDVHITRKKLWWNEDGPVITAEEWLRYVASDPQLRLDPTSERHSVTINIQSDFPDPWLEWFDGDIYSKNPDEAIRGKMIQIATALGAKVQGDDGEIYRSGKADDYYYDE
ncbi:MAG TPA: hypothetical protein VN281_15680 [Verrucomicrobiae bacterium]|jgi:hypothetical protein|nr:hypothetical protein [Verrucomicrobiae bacterium]